MVEGSMFVIEHGYECHIEQQKLHYDVDPADIFGVACQLAGC